jgi:hypothetical protein
LSKDNDRANNCAVREASVAKFVLKRSFYSFVAIGVGEPLSVLSFVDFALIGLGNHADEQQQTRNLHDLKSSARSSIVKRAAQKTRQAAKENMIEAFQKHSTRLIEAN